MNSIYHSPLAMSRLRLFPLTVIHYTIFFIVHNREIGQNFKNSWTIDLSANPIAQLNLHPA